jgi:surface antigen-like variable number repeat protein
MPGVSTLAAAILIGSTTLPDVRFIKSVEIGGAGLPIALETQAGQPFDQARISRDVHRLWSTGRFADLRVESAPAPEGADLVFRVVPRHTLRLRQVRFEPASHKRPLHLETGEPIDAERAQQVAARLRQRLADEGYPESQVRAELVTVGFSQVDLLLHVNPGGHFRIEAVQFSGDLGLTPRELIQALRATRARSWLGMWKSQPDLSDAGLYGDLERLRSVYISRGYFDAHVGVGAIEYTGGRAIVTYEAMSGPRYLVHSLEVTGTDKRLPVSATGDFPSRALCRCLLNARRKSETEGKLEFDAHLEVKQSLAQKEAFISANLEGGPSYSVGRIEFRGNHSVSEITLRRALLLDEGTRLDLDRLGRSLARLNRMRIFEPVTIADIGFIRQPSEHRVDLTISLHEKGWRRWALSGPVAPPSIGGPLVAQLAARLPGWGQGVLEASTWYTTISAFAFYRPILPLKALTAHKSLLPVFALERPYLPGQEWLSGLQVSPQLGPAAMVATYGSAQLRRAVHAALKSDAPEFASLVVPVERVASDWSPGALNCEPSRSHWRRVRTLATFAADWLLASHTL